MKQRRSRRWESLFLAVVLTCLPGRAPSAQRVVVAEGAIFLLRPIGARAVGIGEAEVARHDGSESAWWNPAGLATMTTREVAVHHSQDFFATGDAISLVIPSSLLGVVALSADIEDFGAEENTTGPGVPSNGTILPRSFVFSAAYATPIGSRARTGVAFKVIQLRLDCSGACDLPTSVAQTFALDAGIQYDLDAHQRFSLGASIRNVGLPLQVEDSPQADPLPSRLQVGANFRLPLPESIRKDADLNLALDLLAGLHVAGPWPRIGAEFVWQKRAFLRGGYVFEAAGSQSGGPSLGLGLTSHNIVIDIARLLTGFSADAGQAPTYLSLRFEF